MTLPQGNIVASGGSGSGNGGAGTIYLRSTGDGTDQLVVDNRGTDTGEGSTPLQALGSGVVADLTATSITASGANWQPGALKGMKFNPDVTQSRLFTVIDNDATTLRIDGGEGDLTQVAARGSSFAGTYGFTRLTVAGKARLSCPDRFAVAGELLIDGSTLVTDYIAADKITMKNGGMLSHFRSTLSAAYKLELKALTSVSIDSTSKIDLSGRGYLGGYSGGNSSTSARTNGNASGSTSQSGGSYGGLGGVYGGSANGLYGDLANPNELGSGGGSDYSGYPGGNGGGMLRLVTGALTLDGSILADGGAGSYFYYYGNGGSGGSGGGIRIDATSVSGSGYIYARGGGSTSRGGGGGGRIALYYGSMSLPQGNIVTSGGSGSRVGSAGTVYFH
jgi:hypothetical protein